MSTWNSNEYAFDHGAPCFTARSEIFEQAIKNWISEGIVEIWDGKFAIVGDQQTIMEAEGVNRYVGSPSMNSIFHFLAGSLDIRFETSIGRVEKKRDGWHLISNDYSGSEIFDAVVLAVPPGKARKILDSNSSIFPELSEVKMLPCWVVMAVFDQELELTFDAAFVHNSSLSFMARDSNKPGRRGGEYWILHASPEWTLGHFDLNPKLAAKHLVSELFNQTGLSWRNTVWMHAHRWRHALAANPLSSSYLWNQQTKLGICGDWCMGSRVEGAFLSGKAIADRILSQV
jgi:predicted NAD/FAD-dependent oxidoreductase